MNALLADCWAQIQWITKAKKRGLFRTLKGKIINADVNGAYNITKKVVPNAFAKGIADVLLHPYSIHI